MSKLETFKKLLVAGNDNALLRYSLGSEYVNQKDFQAALRHLKKALEMKPDYSAAWKLYARTLNDNGDIQAAIKAYEEGIVVAEKNGDIQAVKEMWVFLKRLNK